MLREMFDMQKQIQEIAGSKVKSQEFINETALALTAEIFEAVGETPWKPWKKQQHMNQNSFQKEIIDCWKFLINLTLSSGLSPEMLYVLFKEKHNVVLKRFEKGY